MKPMARGILQTLACLLLLVSLDASARTRAWLDRDHIAMGETTTLNIETDTGTAPDYAPLQADFAISGHTSRRQVELGGGKVTSRTLYAVALQPRREGLLTIPGIAVGGEKTNPLPLTVAPTSAATPSQAGADVFLESEPDDASPYVQQAVGWTVRLYSAVPLVSGQLDQPAPPGVSLTQVGEDLRFDRQIGGRDYSVVERHYLLVPDRSGPVEVPGAIFRGRGVSGFFDDLMGRGDSLQAKAPAMTLSVKPIPAQAPQPWLPLQGLELRYLTTPQSAEAGAAATLTVEAVVDGASASQLPELQLPEVAGAQVFPEPVQTEERWVDGRPQVTLRRQFALVPAQPGTLRIPGPQMPWWDAVAGQARTAELPALALEVSAAASSGLPTGSSGATGVARSGGADGAGAVQGQGAASDHQPWVIATVVFGSAWLLTLLWGLHRVPASASGAVAGAVAGPIAPGTKRPPADLSGFARSLDHGDFDEVATRLCALARPPATDIDEARARLADPAQREAVAAVQRARWGDGDGVDARRQLRSAFARGPQWRDSQGGATTSTELLPPLYPPR
ncbi:BatD family protein [Lysobacter sp. H23M47]|uniref:BatD family protein n=1 Tax=Lysobacter sp. H23M47 TaxID=2781024 RepID=UPI001880DCCF|nr:BatD family protein [Lysobacter sp. H23M47]QOW25134.1 BatD family protein [Lysobacter sp. H23M47]